MIAALDKLKIEPPRIISQKADVEVGRIEDKLDTESVGKRILAPLIGRHAVPNLVEMIEDLIAHITPPIKLTRRTLATIVTGTKNRQAALDNPQEFASQAARVIREKAIQQLVDGIQYEKDGTWYEMSEWVEEEETVSDRLVPVDNSIYDHIVVQSETERKFAEKLKKRKDVRLFVKLPGWFKVPTPVGQYNPDWALVMEEAEDTEAGAVSCPRNQKHDGRRRAARHREPEDPLRRTALHRRSERGLQSRHQRRRPALICRSPLDPNRVRREIASQCGRTCLRPTPYPCPTFLRFTLRRPSGIPQSSPCESLISLFLHRSRPRESHGREETSRGTSPALTQPRTSSAASQSPATKGQELLQSSPDFVGG